MVEDEDERRQHTSQPEQEVLYTWFAGSACACESTVVEGTVARLHKGQYQLV